MDRMLKDLQGLNIVVFDLEIKEEIGKNGVTWNSHEKMGISVGCLFDYRSGDTHVYLDDNIRGLADRLLSADLVVGFNIVNFDLKLLGATLGMSALEVDEYDLLTEVRRSTGQQFPKGCKLDEVLLGTFGAHMLKTADGAEAPKMYQQGRRGELISYCLADIRRERLCFEYAYLTGYLKTPTHGKMPMRCPIEIYRANQAKNSSS